MSDITDISNYCLGVNQFYDPKYIFFKKYYDTILNEYRWKQLTTFNSEYEAKMYIDLLGITKLVRNEYSSKIYAIYYE